MSARRLAHHWWLARKFSRIIRLEPRPDMILVALPLPELASICALFGKKTGVPVVVDCRDMWPDIFLERAPNLLRWIARCALWPMERQTRTACHDATAILGHTPAFVEWGLAKGRRTRSWMDQDFPLAHAVQAIDQTAVDAATRWWKDRGVSREGGLFVVAFVGTLTRHLELDVIGEVVRGLRSAGDRIQIVMCGAGDHERALRVVLENDDRLVMPGWVDAPQMAALLAMADVGLAPYRSSPSFVVSIPNKAIEYLSAGLPIITSLEGMLGDLVSREQCGERYHNNSPAALLDTLRRLAKDPGRVATMRVQARRVYAECFESGSVYDRICEHLECIFESTKPDGV